MTWANRVQFTRDQKHVWIYETILVISGSTELIKQFRNEVALVHDRDSVLVFWELDHEVHDGDLRQHIHSWVEEVSENLGDEWLGNFTAHVAAGACHLNGEFEIPHVDNHVALSAVLKHLHKFFNDHLFLLRKQFRVLWRDFSHKFS